MWKEGDDSYPSGFGRPPRKSQFKKGQSGNPKGRPRKSIAPPPEDLTESKLEKIARKILSRKYAVKDGTSSKSITGMEALLQAQFQSAAKGNQRAMQLFLEIDSELERRDRARCEAEQRRAREHFASIVSWKALREKAWSTAESKGGQPQEIWPHPDDIIINEKARSYRIRGPQGASEVPYFDYLAALRDLYLCKAALTLVIWSTVDGFDTDLHLIIAFTNDCQLPRRWQIKDNPEVALYKTAIKGEGWLKRKIAKLEQEALRRHKLAYPFGEKIKLEPKLRKVFKPLLPRLNLRSIAELERQMEQATGNPPLLVVS